MEFYQMLKYLHVKIKNNNEKQHFDFFENEIYSETELTEAFINPELLLKSQLCKLVDFDELERQVLYTAERLEANRIVAARLNKRLSMDELAQMVGCTVQDIIEIEAAFPNNHEKLIQKIKGVLGI